MFARLKNLLAGSATNKYNATLRANLNPQQRQALATILDALPHTDARERELTELVWLLEHAALSSCHRTAIDTFMIQRLPGLRGMMSHAAANTCNPLLPSCIAPANAVAANAKPSFGQLEHAAATPRLAALTAQFLEGEEAKLLQDGAVELMTNTSRVLSPDVLGNVQSLWVIDAALRKPVRPLTQGMFDMLVGLQAAITREDRTAKRLVCSIANPVLAKRA